MYTVITIVTLVLIITAVLVYFLVIKKKQVTAEAPVQQVVQPTPVPVEVAKVEVPVTPVAVIPSQQTTTVTMSAYEEVIVPVTSDETLFYNGFTGTIVFQDASIPLFTGVVEVVTGTFRQFQSNTRDGLVGAFHANIDDYLAVRPPVEVEATPPPKPTKYEWLSIPTQNQLAYVNVANKYLGDILIPANIQIIKDVNAQITQLGTTWKLYRVSGEEPRLPEEGYAGLYHPRLRTIFINNAASRTDDITFMKIYVHEALHVLGYSENSDALAVKEGEIEMKVLAEKPY